jgi:hypothetical protein
MQIITAAIAMGSLIFLLFALVIRADGNMPEPPETPVLSYVGVGFAVMAFLAVAIIPNRVALSGLKHFTRGQGRVLDTNEEAIELCALYQTGLIVGLAILEGATLLQIIAYLLEGQQLSLIVTATLLMGIILQFPIRQRVAAWIERQQGKLEQGDE